MDITRFQPRNDNSVSFESTEFDAGYLAPVSDEAPVSRGDSCLASWRGRYRCGMLQLAAVCL
jgi:hypothetical protein